MTRYIILGNVFATNRSCVLLTLNLIKMDIQTEVQKIHRQFGVTEKANYEIQKLFDKLILEDRAEQLRLGAVVGRGEQLPQNFCTLNQQTCGKGSACKYPHCHL